MENIDFKKNFNKFLTENTKPNPRSAEELRRIIRESILEKKDEEEVVDAEVETTDAPAEPAMDATETETTSDLEGDARTVQDDLEKALEGAKSMGDDKLINQIENTITFLIRSQHSVTEQAEDDSFEGDVNLVVGSYYDLMDPGDGEVREDNEYLGFDLNTREHIFRAENGPGSKEFNFTMMAAEDINEFVK